MDNQDYWLSGIFVLSSYQAKQWKKGSSKSYLYLRLLALLTAKPTVTLHPLRVIKAFIKFSPFGTLDVRVCASWQEKNELRVSQQQQQIKNNVNDEKKNYEIKENSPWHSHKFISIALSAFMQIFLFSHLIDCFNLFVCIYTLSKLFCFVMYKKKLNDIASPLCISIFSFQK